MRALDASCAAIDRLSAALGRIAAAAAFAIVSIQAALVAARYVFGAPTLMGLPIVAAQEAIVYAFALMLMGAMADALRKDAHVRVDVLYDRLDARGRALIDLGGALLLLLPFALVIAWSAWPSVLQSVRAGEGSIDPQGLPARYLLKGSILAMAILLALQGLVQAFKAARTLR